MAEFGTIAAVFGTIETAVNGLKEPKELGLLAKHADAIDAAMEVKRDTQDRYLPMV